MTNEQMKDLESKVRGALEMAPHTFAAEARPALAALMAELRTLREAAEVTLRVVDESPGLHGHDFPMLRRAMAP